MAQAPDREDVSAGIVGSTAAEISESVRDLVERGAYAPGDHLPSVRALAARLGVNRNTVLAAYRSLVTARIAATSGRTGTTVLGPEQNPDEGFTPGSVLRDIGSGNPDSARLPDLATAFAAVTPAHVLYGESVIDAELAEWATEWIAADHPDLSGCRSRPAPSTPSSVSSLRRSCRATAWVSRIRASSPASTRRAWPDTRRSRSPSTVRG